MKRTPLFSPRPTITTCFALVGIAHVASLWFELYRLVPISLVLAILIAQSSGSIKPVPLTRVAQPLIQVLLIYIYALVSTRWSPDPDTALRDAIYMCIAVAPAIILGLTLARRYTGVQIAHGFGVLLVPFVLQSLVGGLGGGDPMLVGNLSMRSTIANIICLISPVLAGAWVLTRSRAFLVFGLMAGLLAVLIGSRSAILFAVPAALVSMYLQDRRFAMRTVRRLALPLVVIVVLAGQSIFARFEPDSTNFQIDEWTLLEELRSPPEERVDFDRRMTTLTSLAIFLEHPLLGGGYSSVLQTNQDEHELEISAHGLIPGSLGELGLVGIGLLTLVIFRLFSRARAASRVSHASNPMLLHFIVSFCTVLLMGLFHQTLESVFFGLILGLLIGAVAQARSRALPRVTSELARAGTLSK